MRQKRRLTYFYFTSPNSSLHCDWEYEKQVLISSSGLFGSEHTVLCFVTIRYVSVWCALYLELFGYKGRQILFFSSLAGNGMEEKTEPVIMKTLRGRKDTLIAKNKYSLRKVTVCDRRKNANSMSGWEAPSSINIQIPPPCAWTFSWNHTISLRNPMLSSRNCVIRNDFWKKRKKRFSCSDKRSKGIILNSRTLGVLYVNLFLR